MCPVGDKDPRNPRSGRIVSKNGHIYTYMNAFGNTLCTAPRNGDASFVAHRNGRPLLPGKDFRGNLSIGEGPHALSSSSSVGGVAPDISGNLTRLI